MAPSSPAWRWGLRLSLLAGSIAVAVRYQQQQHPLGGDITQHETTQDTFCYQGIRTGDDNDENVNCFSVKDGQFSRVFNGESVSERAETRPGYVLPGLWDGHGHLLQYGEFLHSVDLFGSKTADDIRLRLKNYLDANPGTGTRDNWYFTPLLFHSTRSPTNTV